MTLPSGSPPNPLDGIQQRYVMSAEEARAKFPSPCPECRMSMDGEVSYTWFWREAGTPCCGAQATEAGFCARCHNHAENMAVCETCGEAWGDDFGSGELVRHPDYDERPSAAHELAEYRERADQQRKGDEP